MLSQQPTTEQFLHVCGRHVNNTVIWYGYSRVFSLMTKTIQEYFRLCSGDLFSEIIDHRNPDQTMNQAGSLKSYSYDFYTDDISSIYEFIQNTLDAEANHAILAVLDNSYLIIIPNSNNFHLF